MGIQIFCGKPRKDEHEWRQLKEICKIINQYYDKSKPIYLLYNFDLTSRCQIDLLILQETGISILELKSIKGEVIGNTNRNVNWSVKTESSIVELPVNLFAQIRKEGGTLRNKLEQLRKRIFPSIEKDDMKKLQCWGFFKKGSTFNPNQIPAEYHIWFDVITGDDLIRKLSFVDAGYKLDEKDMMAIKDHFKLGDCPEDDPELSFLFIDKLEEAWLPKLMSCTKDYHQKIKNEMIEKGEIKENGDWILNLKSRIFEDGKVSTKPAAIKSINDILKLSNYSIITGFAGTGKSILLHQFYEKIIQNETQYRIPLYIALREIQQYKNNEQVLFNYKNYELPIPSEKDLSDKLLLEICKLVVYSYFENLTKDEDLIKRKDVYLVLFEKLLKENYFVFCLDGYDEITTSKNLVDNWISFLFRENISFLLTTRPIVLTRLQKILGTQGLHYYWLLLPNKQETRGYLENKAKKLGFTSSGINYKDLTPMQLSIRSLFPIKLDLDKNQEFIFQIYGQVLWDAFKHKPSVISNIKSINDITSLLKSEIDERTGSKYSIYDLIVGPIERQYSKIDLHNDASILSICGELSYLSYSGEIDSEYVEKLYKENPFNALFIDPFTLPDISKSIVYFNLPQLRDYFVTLYIYSMYKQGRITSLINSDIMKMFQNLLNDKKPWLNNENLAKFGTSTNEIIVKYLVESPINLKPTATLFESDVVGHLAIMGRTRLGVPEWYRDLVKGIINEISKENEPIRNERLSNGLMQIIEQIPEFSMNQAYDTIINDWDFDSYSISIEPYAYMKQFKEIFPEFNRLLESNMQELFDDLNIVPKNKKCPACVIESELEERDKRESDNDENIDEEIDYLMNLTYTFDLSHDVKGNPYQVYLLNLLESEIDDGIKSWTISANKYDTISSFQGLLRHRSDITDDSYLQFISGRLIEVAKTKYLAYYALTIWNNLLDGMDADGGAHIPGPAIIPEFAINAINSLLKKEVIWENIVQILYSMALKSDKYSELGILLFEEIRESISDETFRKLTFKLVSNVMYSKGDNLKNQLNCLKGFEDFWLPILLGSSFDGLAHLSNLELSSYNFTAKDLEQIYSLVKLSLESQKELNFNPRILMYLHSKEFPIVWTDFLKFIGLSDEIDAFFRNIIPNDLDEEEILKSINELEENHDKILVAFITRINEDYFEDFLKSYLLIADSIENTSLFQSWLIELFDDEKSHLYTYKLESQIKKWLFEKSDKINFLDSILSNKEVDFNRLSKLFGQLSYYYDRDYYQGIEEEIKLKIKEFWDKNQSVNIIRNILSKMIDSANEKYCSSHKYWIKYLFPYIDKFASLEELLFEYITNLFSYEGTNYYDNNLIFYLNEKPNKNLHELIFKAINNITKKIEIKNITNALKYRLYFVDDEKIIDRKKDFRINSKKEKDFFKEVITLLINKDIELLEKSIYNKIEFNNFELIDLVSRLESSLICDYIKKLVMYDISEYHIEQLLVAIEKYCYKKSMKSELEIIKSNLLKESATYKKEDSKWKKERLEKLLIKCNSLIDPTNNS